MSAAPSEPEEQPRLGADPSRDPRCAEPDCLAPAVLMRNDVGRCVRCHRASNGGRII